MDPKNMVTITENDKIKIDEVDNLGEKSQQQHHNEKGLTSVQVRRLVLYLLEY